VSEVINWPGWRGPTRDGRVAYLPRELKAPPDIVWRVPLARSGLGGIAATQDYVILGDRDITNESDEFRCYSATTGDLLWTVAYPAPGSLDYDNAPRATPVIHGDYVFLLGAFGHLTCADIHTGLEFWKTNILKEFDGEKELVWGSCSSPLIVDGKLIVNPGGPESSLVALDPDTGVAAWKSPGDRHAYGSFIVATLGGKRQIVGHDRTTLGGWDVATGKRLWTLKPPRNNDFNVPTPVEVNGKLLVATENNYVRLYDFDNQGRIVPTPVAHYDQLAPDMSTPIVVGNRVYCVCEKMFCLDLANGLKEIWTAKDPAFCDYAPLLATDDRVLVLGLGGELLLIDATTDEFRIISRQHLFDGEEARAAELYAHPAMVGTRLYVRGEKELVCVELGDGETRL
jgi:outer membrane protein assembly factor BamB